MNAEFYKPERAFVFVIVALLLFFIWRSHKLRALYAHLLKTAKSLDMSAAYRVSKNRKLKEIIFILAVLCVGISLLRPRWGEKERVRKIQGVDLCVALDLSNSMLAEDMNPSRLQYAKRELTLLLEKLPEMRVTLVGFAGGAFIVTPLTNDLEAIADFLSPLSPEFVSRPATNLESALTTCSEALGYKDITLRDEEGNPETSAGAVLLVTDGDDEAEINSDILNGFKKYKIPVFSYLLGKAQPVQIPLRDPNGNLTGFVRDPGTGAAASTAVQEKVVTDLAEETKGKVYLASQLSNFGPTFSSDIKKFESKAREDGVDVEKEDQFQIPLLIGILLLLLEMFVTETGGAFAFLKKRKALHGIVLFVVFLPHFSYAFSIGESLRNNFGVLLNNQDRHKEAQIWFQKNVENSPDQKIFLFNWIASRLTKLNKYLADDVAKGDLDPKDIGSTPIGAEGMELARILESLANEEQDQALKKEWFYQLGQAYELSGQKGQAIEAYYNAIVNEAANAAGSKELESSARHNLARLLQNPSQSGGGGEGSDGGKDGDEGNGDPSKGNKGNEPPKTKPQEYKGENFTKEQIKQILQNVGSEEQNVLKKKSKEETKRRSKEQGKGSGGRPW